ncbi:MAG: metallophosphoesterase [Bacteroidales bacterium]|nr:metallophosphoesterase [Bacteroidales bacterium]MBS3775468.1 metallophosphoesterase [Bacteroidales bacterium]
MKIAIISDIHEDIVNLKTALKQIEKIHADQIVCLGDISGYSIPYYNHLDTRNAHECLQLVRSNCEYVVLGNHDMHAAGIIPRINPDFGYPDNWFQLDYHERKKIASDKIWLHEENDINPLFSRDDIKYLRSLPEYVVLPTKKGNILFSHYVYPNLTGVGKSFYTYSDEFRKHFEFTRQKKSLYSFFGHTHVNGLMKVMQKRIKKYRFRQAATVSNHNAISVPSIALNGKRNGFCVFDVKELEVKSFRIY